MVCELCLYKAVKKKTKWKKIKLMGSSLHITEAFVNVS